MEKKVLYDDGKDRFTLTVDEDTYERLRICNARGVSFTMLVEGVKSKTRTAIDSAYIQIK